MSERKMRHTSSRMWQWIACGLEFRGGSAESTSPQHTNEYAFLTWNDFSIRTSHHMKQKWGNYYSKPHDEHARLLYIYFHNSNLLNLHNYAGCRVGVAASTISLHSCRAPKKLRLNEASLYCCWKLERQVISFARTCTQLTASFFFSFWFTHISLGYVPFLQAKHTHTPLQSEINTQSHVWMARCEPSGASVVVHMRRTLDKTHRDIDERTHTRTHPA